MSFKSTTTAFKRKKKRVNLQVFLVLSFPIWNHKLASMSWYQMPDRVIENITVDFMQTEGITSKFRGRLEFSIQLLFLIPGEKEN